MWQKLDKNRYRTAGMHVEGIVTRNPNYGSVWHWKILHNGKVLRKSARTNSRYLQEAQRQAEELITYYDDQIEKSQVINTVVRRRKLADQVMSHLSREEA